MKNVKNYLFLFLSAGVILTGCEEEPWIRDEIGKTDWRITVKNSAGVKQPGAKVTIYPTFEDWKTETNPSGSIVANDEGTAIFAELKEQKYYASIAKGDLNNWENYITSDLPMAKNKITTQTITITETISGLLSKAAGKKWGLKVQTTSGKIDVLATCSADDILILYKGILSGKAVNDEGPTKCNSTDPQQETGTWNYSPSTKTLSLSDGTISIDYLVESITPETLKIKVVGSSPEVKRTYIVK